MPAARSLATRLRPLYLVVFHKYYIDELYHLVIVRPLRFSAWLLWYVVDAFLIDKVLVQLWAIVIGSLGKAIRYVQDGDVQRYLGATVVGTAGILFVTTTWVPRRAVDVKLTQAGRKVTLEAGQGHAPKDLVYTVDWDGKGRWDAPTRFTTLTHEYDAPGTYKIVVKAEDPRWGTVSRSDELFGPGAKRVRVE